MSKDESSKVGGTDTEGKTGRSWWGTGTQTSSKYPHVTEDTTADGWRTRNCGFYIPWEDHQTPLGVFVALRKLRKLI